VLKELKVPLKGHREVLELKELKEPREHKEESKVL
jgi:hypothetical protein